MSGAAFPALRVPGRGIGGHVTPRLKKATESAVACGGRGSMRQACLQALEAAGRAVTMEWQGLGRRLVI